MPETAPRPDVPDEPALVPSIPPHQLAGYTAVYEVIQGTPGDAWRNALIWRAVEAYRSASEAAHERQVLERTAAETRRETAERVLLASDVALGYRCPACHGKPAAHRWKDTGRKKRYVCGCGHQWDAPSRSAQWRTALDASPTALLRKVAETGDLPEVPEKIARGES